MEARYWRNTPQNKIECFLCPHNCLIGNNALGRCRVRRNRKGKLESLNYARLAACAVDPIEKKPFYHFLPASLAYSIACAGCNFRCDFCQNWEVSQQKNITGKTTTPEAVTARAVEAGCRSIAYTYTEPTVYFEFAYDCAAAASEKGLANIFVTNGYICAAPLKRIAPYLHAANVDLKSFRDDFYRKYCGARLSPVLDSIGLMHACGIWVEVTTLLIPGVNDSSRELADIAAFVASLDKNIPWHISRFHPDYNMRDIAPTPPQVLRQAYAIGREKGLNFVYVGNIQTAYGKDTVCPACGRPVIRRKGFSVAGINIPGGNCGFCRQPIAGVFLK